MPTFHTSDPQIRERLRDLPGVLAGRLPDVNGAVRGVLLAAGVQALGEVSRNFTAASEGATNELTGEPWEPPAAATLALRRKDSGAAKVAKLAQRLAGLPAHRRLQIDRQYKRLYQLYTAEGGVGAKARRHAKGLLRLLKRHGLIAPTRARKLAGELRKPLGTSRAYRLALSGAFALILRDTGRLLAALTPVVGQTSPVTPGQVLEAGPGFVVVGIQGDLGRIANYHTSARPRRLKRDGSPRLPRRQFLPDEGRVPGGWTRAVTDTVRAALRSQSFWDAYLSA